MRNTQRWKGLKPESKFKLHGQYMEKNSSRSTRVEFVFNDGILSVFESNKCLDERLAIESIQGKRNIYLDNGCLFVSDLDLSEKQSKLLLPKSEFTIRWLEKLTTKKFFLYIFSLFALLAIYRYAFILATSIIVMYFPLEWEKKLGKSTYNNLKISLLEDTKIEEERREKITLKAQDLISVSNLAEIPKIMFHQSKSLGANALALPGGPIIITDGLVNLLETDPLILSIIAHEIVHIQERHSLEQIVQIVGVSSFAWLLFGAEEAIIEEVLYIAVNLWSLKKSRDFEREADLKAIEILRKAGIPENSLLKAMKKLSNYSCSKKRGDKSLCLKDTGSGWLSTHPSDSERLDYISENITK